MSERITYRQLKPFCLPTSLDDLSGPHTGSLRLPIHLCWSPGDHVFDLARLGDALTVYQCVIAEGTTQEQHEYLNHALLIELWPHLHLDVRIIAAWENTFDSLRGKTNGGASTPHPRTRRNSIPAAQECTPPGLLMQGIPTHTSHYRRRWEAEGYQTEHVGGGQFQVLRHGWTSSFPQITSSASQVALWTHLRAC